MKKSRRRQRGRTVKRQRKSNLLNETKTEVDIEDNMVTRVLRAKMKKDGGGEPFDVLKVFPPKWWN
jgi:hypothetical protein